MSYPSPGGFPGPVHWPLAVLALQALCMAADEFFFHRRRPLPRWERVGHPLDTLTVLLPLGLALLAPPQAPWTGLFLAGAVFSCLFVTKDEPVHARLCGAGESWLHAVLFVLHPMVFLALFALWRAGETDWLLAQAALTTAFLGWQTVYWNFLRPAEARAADDAPVPVNNAFYDELGDRWLHAQDDPVALLRAEGKAKQAWIEERLEAAFGSAAGRSLRILDVGCGAGFLARRLASLGHEVHALDFSRGSLLTSRRAELQDAGARPGARYVQGDALALPFGDAAFDVVCSLDFLEHVEDPAATVAEAARVLKSGGLFFFHTFNRNLPAWLIVIKGLEWFVKNTPPHMHVLRLFIKPKELAEFCRSSGLMPQAWTGLRPDFRRRAFWKMLRTGRVPEDFAFERTSSLLLSYLGVAKKA